jgi:hypothetical protein
MWHNCVTKPVNGGILSLLYLALAVFTLAIAATYQYMFSCAVYTSCVVLCGVRLFCCLVRCTPLLLSCAVYASCVVLCGVRLLCCLVWCTPHMLSCAVYASCVVLCGVRLICCLVRCTPLVFQHPPTGTIGGGEATEIRIQLAQERYTTAHSFCCARCAITAASA